MIRTVILLICFTLFITGAFSQQPEGMGGGAGPVQSNTPCLTTHQRNEIFTQLDINRIELIEKGILSEIPDPTEDIVSLEWPLRQNSNYDDNGYHAISNFVDHNHNSPNQIKDYNCGNRTYDTQTNYNHSGTDFYLWPFHWYKMDNDIVEVVAAAPGVIIDKRDNNFDRNCSFNTDNWNAVYIQHSDNSVAWYGHLKKGSLTSKNIGESVAVGEFLGVVGSSGNSTGPHLHFEIYDGANNLVDPYSGTCNSLNSSSWWADQRDYYDSEINAIMTHSASPDFANCPQQEIISEEENFNAGEVIYLAAYYRDQLQGQQSNFTIYRPDGFVWDSWVHSPTEGHYSSSYWFWWRTLPTELDGVWKFEVSYEGKTYTKTFNVGVAQSIEAENFPSHIKVFPNPAKDNIFLSFEENGYKNAEINLINMVGKSVANIKIGAIPVNYSLKIPIENLSTGVYFLLVELDGKVFRKKVLVE